MPFPRLRSLLLTSWRQRTHSLSSKTSWTTECPTRPHTCSSTDVPFNSQLTDMTTATIQDTTVLLDQLYTGYNEVLQQAQKQLEDIDLSPAQIRTISNTVTSDTTFKKDVADKVSNSFRDAIAKEGEDLNIDSLVNRLRTRLQADLEAGLAALVNNLAEEAIKQYIASPEFTEKLDAKVQEYKDIADSIALDVTFTEMIQYRVDQINERQKAGGTEG